MSDDISEPGKISKNYSEPFKAYWETIFDESVSEVDRQRSNYMSDDISYPGKIIRSFHAYSEATFDYSTTENIQTITDYIAECISIWKKIPKQFPSRWKHIERLLSIIAIQKWVDFVWKICLMIYRPRKKFQNYSEPFRANSVATLDYSTIESSQKM